MIRHCLGVETIFFFEVQTQKFLAGIRKDYGLQENILSSQPFLCILCYDFCTILCFFSPLFLYFFIKIYLEAVELNLARLIFGITKAHGSFLK